MENHTKTNLEYRSFTEQDIYGKYALEQTDLQKFDGDGILKESSYTN